MIGAKDFFLLDDSGAIIAHKGTEEQKGHFAKMARRGRMETDESRT
jgi:hypothetical protein